MMRKLITILLFFPIVLIAQKPFINSINPTHVEVGQIVTISGSNLSGFPQVFFGGVKATIVNVRSSNVIEAIVPAGATHESIIVLNNGLIAQSSEHFFITFSGSDITQYDPEYDEISTTEQAASDICMCDLDNDDKNDIVIVHNVTDENRSEVTIFRNNTSGTGPLAAPNDFELDQTLNNSINDSGFNAVACRDLDNDGDKDLAFTSNLGNNPRDIYIYENTSTPGTIMLNEVDITSLILPLTSDGDQRLPRSVSISDMDRDGFADLVVGNNSDNTFHIFRNSGSLNFADAVEIVANNEPTGILEVADFNNDGYLDVVTLTFRVTNTGIHFFRNLSTINNFNFEYQETVSNGGQNSDISIGDLDNDGLNDIVAASRNTGLISVFRNQSTLSQIAFGTNSNVSTTGTAASGVTLADFNGDGKLDIASSNATGGIYIFENTSASSITFGTEQLQSTSSTTQFIASGDLNGDAKPDIAYTQSVQITEEGKLGIILNRNCVEPVLSPAPGDGGVFCSNPQTFTLTATASPEATYDWTVTGNTNAGGNSFSTGTSNMATFDLSSDATTTIQVTITQDGICSAQSDTQEYTIAASVTDDPTILISSAGGLCVGDNVTLSTSGSYNNYFWTLPDGSTVSSSTVQLNPVSVSDAGAYSLRVQNSGSCSSSEVTTLVDVSQSPQLEIINNDFDNFCAGATPGVTLEVPDYTGFLTYKWQLGGADFGAGSVPTITTNQAGNYTVEVEDGNGCVTETAAYAITAIPPPVSMVDGPLETCVGIETSFVAASTGQSGFTLTFDWLVDGNPVTPTNPIELLTTFSTTGPHTVTLTTSYDPTEVESCSEVEVFNVTVSNPPTITFNQPSTVSKCQADPINLEVTNSGISSYTWSVWDATENTLIQANASTSASFNLNTPIGVDAVFAIVDLVTDINCEIRDTILVVNFPTEGDIALLDMSTPDQVLLEDDISIQLVSKNVTNPRWRPNEIMDDSTALNVTVFPNQPSTFVTLFGTDTEGCEVSSQIEIILDNLRPKRTFSPNGDGQNDCWEILNSSQPNTEGCKIYIFDSRGRNIKVADAPFENNCVWDGNSNGASVPEGVYYFVFKCNDSQMSKSGSILLAR